MGIILYVFPPNLLFLIPVDKRNHNAANAQSSILLSCDGHYCLISSILQSPIRVQTRNLLTARGSRFTVLHILPKSSGRQPLSARLPKNTSMLPFANNGQVALVRTERESNHGQNSIVCPPNGALEDGEFRSFIMHLSTTETT